MNRWKYLRRRFTKEPKFALPEKEWLLMRYLRFLEPFIHRRKPLRQSETPPESELNEHEYQSTIGLQGKARLMIGIHLQSYKISVYLF